MKAGGLVCDVEGEKKTKSLGSKYAIFLSLPGFWWGSTFFIRAALWLTLMR